MRSLCCLCIALIVAWQRLGKNPFIVAKQRLGKNFRIAARQRLGANVTAVANIHATIVGRVVFKVARVVSRKVGDELFPEYLVVFRAVIIPWQV
jgi:hypothetical protein